MPFRDFISKTSKKGRYNKMTLKLTGITPNGNKVYQAVENGVRTILTKTADEHPLQKIQIRKAHEGFKGSFVDIKNLETGITHSLGDVTDLESDKLYRTITKSTTDAKGNKKEISITRSAAGDSFEVCHMQSRPNGEEFCHIQNQTQTPNGLHSVEEFDTMGWTKQNGEEIFGRYQKDTMQENGNTFVQISGDINEIPNIKEL